MQTFNGTKFKKVIDKALIPMGRAGLKRVFKGSFKGS